MMSIRDAMYIEHRLYGNEQLSDALERARSVGDGALAEAMLAEVQRHNDALRDLRALLRTRQS